MKKWKNYEIKYLKKNFPKLKTQDIAIKLNRSYESVRKKGEKLNLIKEYKKFAQKIPIFSKQKADLIQKELERSVH